MPFFKQSIDYQTTAGKINKNLCIEDFLHQHGIKNFKLQQLAGDASCRQYYRVYASNNTYILMDSSQELNALANFIKINSLLQQHGIKAPHMHAESMNSGLLLLEDFGDCTLRSFITNSPQDAPVLYEQAVDVLHILSNITNTLELPQYDDKKLFAELELFLNWHVKPMLPINLFIDAKLELKNILSKLYKSLSGNTLILKDFMADNIMVISNPNKQLKLGILDFQDALFGFNGYDLVSLLQDVRFKVDEQLEQQCIAQYLRHNADLTYEQFMRQYALLGLHNNLRIAGCFNRLINSMGKKQYSQFLPLTWQHITKNLEHPDLCDVKKWFIKYGLYNGIKN